jgi:hypothetical protein
MMGFVFALSGGESEEQPESNMFLVFETPTEVAIASEARGAVLEAIPAVTPTATATAVTGPA